MCADRDSSASPGLRALLGRFLHGLLQYRVFQLLAAAWSYLVGLSGASLFSLLPSAWVLHRSVGPDELPEMLEALGLRSGPWEELAPWKAMKADLELVTPWAGYVPSGKEQEPWDSAMDELGSWHSKMQALWDPGLGTWTDLVDPNQEEDDDGCCSKSSGSLHKMKPESGVCDVDGEKIGARVHASPLGMVSCIFKPASGGVFTWLDLGNEQSLENKDDDDEICRHSESNAEIEHIRSKRLWFLQQNQSQDVPSSGHQPDVQEPPLGPVQDGSVSADPTLLTKVSGWHHELNKDRSDNQLLSDFDLERSRVVEFPGTDPDSKLCPLLSLQIQKPDVLDNSQNKYLPSPDQDQGYHSLEDWQCVTSTQDLPSGGISPPHISGSGWNNDGAHVPAELSCSLVKEDDEGRDGMDSDLEEEIHASAMPVCTNKHIGYILGTVVSDDEEEDSGSSCEDEDDDGFDSEGSVSATESDIPVPEEVVLWTSFCSADPYNPQNFTASLQTGPIAEVNSHLEDKDTSDDEESWCDSDVVSDSEDEFSANEEESLKLWNGFLKSEDPYNPLFFKASVHTSEWKRQKSDAATKHLELVCTSPSTCELTVPTHPNEYRPLRVREKHSVSMEQSANVSHKKVTFCEKVTIYYVCDEEERKGHWEEFARDRCRFQRRIQDTESMIGHCFTPDHRQRVWNRMQEIWFS